MMPSEPTRLVKPIVVIADDLSGAAELAAVARRRGMTVELQTTFSRDTSAEAICVATQTRSSTPQAAALAVGALMRDITAVRPRWVFKKCDSVLRGPVLAEAWAVAAVIGVSKLTLISANPSRDRLLKAGEFWVNGRRLHETDFANDPENPRTTSRVVELLTGDLTHVAVPDVTSLSDLKAIATELAIDRLPVGGADFFEALLDAREPGRVPVEARPAIHADAGVTVLVCGSRISWPQRRRDAEARGVRAFSIPYDEPELWDAVSKTKRVLIGIGETAATENRSPAQLVEILGEAVARLVKKSSIDHLLVEGGATAGVLMRRLNWTRFAVDAVKPGGLVVLHPLDGTKTDIIIKPGSYPWPNEL